MPTEEMKLTQLDLLREAKGLLPDEEIAERARNILDADSDYAHIAAGIGRAVEAYEQQRMLERNRKAIRDAMLPDNSVAIRSEPQMAIPDALRPTHFALEIPSTRVGLADYLIRKGHTGPDTARLIVEFQREVASAYVEANGDYPPRDEQKVWVFDASDLPLIDSVYAAKINEIAAVAMGSD